MLRNEHKLEALESIIQTLRESGKHAGNLIKYTTMLGAIAAIGTSHLPAELELLVGGIGINLMSNLIDRVTQGEKFSAQKLKSEVEEAIKASNIENALTTNDFYKVASKLFRGQDLLAHTIQHAEFNLGLQLEEILVQVGQLTDSLNKDPEVSKKRVDIVFDGDFSDFDETRREDLRNVLAGWLNLNKENIRILSVIQGSIIVLLEMPEFSAQELYFRFITDDSMIAQLNIKHVRIRRPVNLSGRNMYRANLSGHVLMYSNLSNSNLQKADLSRAILINANLRYVNLQEASLRGTRLDGAFLIGSNLQGADLTVANLSITDMSFTDLRGATIAGMLFRTKMNFADLRGADLSDAFMSEVSLDNIIYDETTKWPSGLQSLALVPA